VRVTVTSFPLGWLYDLRLSDRAELIAPRAMSSRTVGGHTSMSSRGWILFGAVSVLWGIPYALIKVALAGGVPPALLAMARTSIGALVLLALARRAGVLGSVRGRLRWLSLYALTEVALPFPLLAVGERKVSSSFAAILIATAPLFVAVLAFRLDADERVTGRRLAGLAGGLLGVVALVGTGTGGGSGLLLGAATVLLVALCYAVAPLILKGHLSDLDPCTSTGVSLAIASLLLSPAAALDRPAHLPSTHALAALIGLGLFCTAAALTLYAALVAEAGAGRALVVTYLNPVVALALGICILGEHPGAGAVAGLAMILTGAWFATDGRLPRLARSTRSRPTHIQPHTGRAMTVPQGARGT
jgi:drug/metabolite transporter (DMT)-like permease